MHPEHLQDAARRLAERIHEHVDAVRSEAAPDELHGKHLAVAAAYVDYHRALQALGVTDDGDALWELLEEADAASTGRDVDDHEEDREADEPPDDPVIYVTATHMLAIQDLALLAAAGLDAQRRLWPDEHSPAGMSSLDCVEALIHEKGLDALVRDAPDAGLAYVGGSTGLDVLPFAEAMERFGGPDESDADDYA